MQAVNKAMEAMFFPNDKLGGWFYMIFTWGFTTFWKRKRIENLSETSRKKIGKTVRLSPIRETHNWTMAGTIKGMVHGCEPKN